MEYTILIKEPVYDAHFPYFFDLWSPLLVGC